MSTNWVNSWNVVYDANKLLNVYKLNKIFGIVRFNGSMNELFSQIELNRVSYSVQNNMNFNNAQMKKLYL